jgi:ABC-type transport system involved in multi-copper enzyme maturation permease subunit
MSEAVVPAARVPADPIPAARLVRAIAVNTFREAVRDRVLYLLLFFALGLILVSRAVALITVGDEGKILKDFGLASIGIFGVLTAVLVGVGLVFREIDKRTIHVILARPIRRWHFIVGKFAGLALVLALNAALMTAGLYALLAVYGEADASLLPAIGLLYLEQLVMTAVALLFSSFSTPILSTLMTLALYVAGHLSWSLLMLAGKMPAGVGQQVCRAVYYGFPNLERLNIKAEVVHQLTPPAADLVLAAGYGAGWAALLLVLACALFSRREFV